ncbi:deoxyuridinetriphosphatase [Wigglesworthia glossinidia endosymbiont of Glossina morsitans morsitans (Yale colony)]|uniref:dUTP diphosphatase n=1 Tax=Wigglesworthia glossinidia endosymbiont of Glossina morsitans morsitans (Yale colony) TaxID=1142511 RepID=H6Q4R4_WIGGL|nr:dUTP diphosphatase [Wigglesworthia glossinidia]AFA41197.1 deoxyuridinetriphosphatase [Wigglesworthia glossinidia endosymbiont of Glossina morsitans morsitans (Yale colony)]
MKKKISIKILDHDFGKKFPLPQYYTKGSSGIDLRACIRSNLLIKANNIALISTGIAMHIADQNLSGLILPRSGLAHNHGIVLSNTVGVIDSDYQGPIYLSVLNRSKKDFLISPGDRIAQIIFVCISQVYLDIVTDFCHHTERKDSGLGHSGIK